MMLSKRASSRFLSFSLLVVLVLGLFSVPAGRSNATPPPSDLTGYAWSDTIGWISLNCANTASCATSSYKVTLDNTSNNLTGYAWSDNIGWIEFGGANSNSGCPIGICQARKSGGSLLGWARTLNGDGVAAIVTTPGTTTYATAGTQSFTVPTGVTSLTAALTGAGGSPATTSAIAVTAGEVLTAIVGSGGTNTTLKRGASTLATGNGAGGSGALSFAAKVDYITGASPQSVALGDVNGDGTADMVTANYNPDTASVLFNNGNGTFATKVDYPTGIDPIAIALGDINADNKADIVTANRTANTASVLLNNGNGTFATKVDYTPGGSPDAVALGDVSGDGKADMVIANFGNGGVSVFFGSGNGTFAGKTDYITGGGPDSVVLGDVNGDGKADMVVANSSVNTASILLNNGTGTFAPKVDYTTGTNPFAVALGDINGDSKADIVVTNQSGTTVSVFLNNGNGTFAAKVDYTTGSNPEGVALADVNGDGKVDMVVANKSTSNASVLLNTTPFSLGSAILSYAGNVTPPPNGSDGWISLSSANGGGSTYGVTVGTNSLGGYAWGSDVMGWIDFSAVNFTPPCAISNSCSIDHTQSINKDAWCTITTTTCGAGYICSDTGGLCIAGNPSGTMTFSNQKVKKGKTVTISWNVLYADSCVVSGTNGDNWTPASSSVQTSQAIQNEATYTLSCQPVGGGTPVLLDTKKVTLIPSIREF